MGVVVGVAGPVDASSLPGVARGVAVAGRVDVGIDGDVAVALVTRRGALVAGVVEAAVIVGSVATVRVDDAVGAVDVAMLVTVDLAVGIAAAVVVGDGTGVVVARASGATAVLVGVSDDVRVGGFVPVGAGRVGVGWSIDAPVAVGWSVGAPVAVGMLVPVGVPVGAAVCMAMDVAVLALALDGVLAISLW